MELSAEQCRVWFKEQISEIQKIQNKKFRLILLISLTDAFAQSYVSYKRGSSRRCFSGFILQYNSGKKYEKILRSVCPVTLYYDKRDEYPFEKLNLEISRIYLADSSVMIREEERLVKCVPNENRECVTRHRYAELIYAMRNKLVHEMIDIGLDLNFLDNEARQIPHVIHGNSKNEYGVWLESWKLHIPETFIFEVLETAVNEYLTWCENNQKMPFKNNLLTRKCYLTWYDK